MKNKCLQQGKTRWTHYQTGDHLVWIPKYRKKVLVGEVQKELKTLDIGFGLQLTTLGTVGQVSSETIIRYMTQCQGK